MKRFIVLALAAILSLHGCDGVDDAGPGVALDDDVVAAPDVPGEFASSLPDLTGRVYLFSRLETYRPTDMLNSTWTKDLANHTIVILLRIDAHDRATDAISASVVSGAAALDAETGAVVAYHPDRTPVVLEVVIEDGVFEVEEPFEWDLMTENLSRALPMVDLTGYGEVLPDGTGIRNGFFEGGVLEGDMQTLCMGVAGLGAVNLQWFMTLGGICADRDTDGDGVPDAYTFDWYFDAVEVTDLYDPSPLHVVPWLDECVAHTGSCPLGP